MDLNVNQDSNLHLCNLPRLVSISETHSSHLKSEDGAHSHRAVVKMKYYEIMGVARSLHKTQPTQ